MTTHTLQKHSFPDGGWVIHKATLPDRKGHFSAWFDASGKLLDAEQRLSNWATRNATQHQKTDLQHYYGTK